MVTPTHEGELRPVAGPRNAADLLLAGFASAVRHAGVGVTADRTQLFLLAAAATGAGSQAGVYWAGRATLCATPDDLDAYDRVFDAWFGNTVLRGRARPAPARRTIQADLHDRDEPSGGDVGDDDAVRTVASATEVLRHRDIAEMSAADRAGLVALFATLRPRPPTRRGVRRRPARRGEVDAGRTLREELRRAGEPGPVRYRRRGRRPRRVVALIDISGSMNPYADSLLRLAHVLARSAPRTTEVFTIGTRLTRVSRALRQRDPGAALKQAGDTVPDWSGGTRLGEMVKAFLDRWGQRGMARGAVVVIFSDGWERGDCELLAESMRRLARLAHRVVWVNPHRGKAGYLPLQGGMAAALPHVDHFVAGHSMATFQAVIGVVSDA